VKEARTTEVVVGAGVVGAGVAAGWQAARAIRRGRQTRRLIGLLFTKSDRISLDGFSILCDSTGMDAIKTTKKALKEGL
jgi:hypothetical protein